MENRQGRDAGGGITHGHESIHARLMSPDILPALRRSGAGWKGKGNKMNRFNPTVGFGLILIGIGLFFLAANIFRIDAEYFWPLIFLALALIMLSTYFSNRARNCGVLVPFGIFVVLFVIFQFCSLFGWHYMDYLWPGFIFAPGFGLFLLYLEKREAGLLVPVTILIGLSGVFFISMTEMKRYWPALLIGAGILLVLNSLRKRPQA